MAKALSLKALPPWAKQADHDLNGSLEEESYLYLKYHVMNHKRPVKHLAFAREQKGFSEFLALRKLTTKRSAIFFKGDPKPGNGLQVLLAVGEVNLNGPILRQLTGIE